MSRRNQSGKRRAIGFDPKKLEEELHAARRTPTTIPADDGLADWERELLTDQTKTGEEQFPVHNPFGIELGL